MFLAGLAEHIVVNLSSINLTHDRVLRVLFFKRRFSVKTIGANLIKKAHEEFVCIFLFVFFVLTPIGRKILNEGYRF